MAAVSLLGMWVVVLLRVLRVSVETTFLVVAQLFRDFVEVSCLKLVR